MQSFLRETLPRRYGLQVRALEQAAGGWTAAAFVVRADAGSFFAKVYDTHRSSTRPWIDRMDLYLPVVRWLSDDTPLGGQMVAPIPTLDGEDRARDDRFVLLLFPLIPGSALDAAPLTPPQIAQLAHALALLHAHSAQTIPLSTAALQETYALPFLDTLHAVLGADELPPPLQSALQPHLPGLTQAAHTLQQLAEGLRADPPRHALCHTDLHGGNLMWDGRLILIDWEGLQLAPVESDLFAFSDGFFFAAAREAFCTAYRAARPGYAVNPDAMRFYRLRRRLEDVAEFCHSLAHDPLTPQAQSASLTHLHYACLSLHAMQA